MSYEFEMLFLFWLVVMSLLSILDKIDDVRDSEDEFLECWSGYF